MPHDSGDAHTKLMACDGLGHFEDVVADDAHGHLAIAAASEVKALIATACGLRGGSVDDGDEVIAYDDAVLASLRGVLRDEGLLYDLHVVVWWRNGMTT